MSNNNSPKGFYKLNDNRWVDEDSFTALTFGGNIFSDILVVLVAAPIVCAFIWPDAVFGFINRILDWLIAKGV